MRVHTHRLVNHPALKPRLGMTTHIPAPETIPLTSPTTVVGALISEPE